MEVDKLIMAWTFVIFIILNISQKLFICLAVFLVPLYIKLKQRENEEKHKLWHKMKMLAEQQLLNSNSLLRVSFTGKEDCQCFSKPLILLKCQMSQLVDFGMYSESYLWW